MGTLQLFHWEQNSGKTEMVFRHDAHHLCTSSCSFLPAGQSAPCPLTPELHSCFSLQSFPSLFCALAPGKLSSCSWCGEGKDRAVGGVSERTGLQRPHAGDRSPCHISAMSPLLCIAKSAIAESRKHLVSLRKVQSSTPSLTCIFPGSPHSFVFASRMCSLTFHSRLNHVLLALQTARVAQQKHSVLVICSPEL